MKRGFEQKRIQVILSREQYELIQIVRRKLGLSSDSETVKVIILSWLAEKSIISSLIKGKIQLGVEKDENENES